MEPTIEKIEADITLSPSEGETFEEYTACLSEALADLVFDDSIQATLKSGQRVVLVIEGMPESDSPSEDDSTFDMNAFLEDRIKEFAADNPELLTELGTAVLRDHIYEFFETLLASENKAKADRPTETAVNICKSLGIELPVKK